VKQFRAPWSASLIVVSLFATACCSGATIALIWKVRGPAVSVAVLPLGIVIAATLFTIRGYTVTSDAILVHRLFWKTLLPLTGLQSARFAPNSMRRSFRLFGNAGMFSYSGLYRNRLLGTYRAFVTDEHRTIVLEYPERIVLISPASPEEFVRELRR
jgi:hypothetical protein